MSRRNLILTIFAVVALVAPIGTAGAGLSLNTGSALDTGDGDVSATPLAAPKPGWLTPELEAEVLAADGVPVQAPTDAPLPGEVGIRPGSWMVSPSGCTMDFIFQSSGQFGIGSAGHCAETGEEVILLTLAPGGENPVLVNIGQVVVSHDNDIGDDFGLTEIDPRLSDWVSATTAIVGGPCGSYTGSDPQALLHYGHGLVVGTGGTPRAGLGLFFENTAYWWTGVGSPGDSGSPVVTGSSAAAGNLTHLVVDTRRPGATLAGTRISKMLQIAGGWTLVDSPLCSGASSDSSSDDEGQGNGNGKSDDRPPRGKKPSNG